MPTVLRVGLYRIMICTHDHPPAHVHVVRDGKVVKLEIGAQVRVIYYHPKLKSELSKIREIITENQASSWGNGLNCMERRQIPMMNEQDGIPFDENNSPVAVEIKENRVWVTLADGRIISNPLEWHPWLMNATPQQLSHIEFWTDAVYFTELDEGLDVEAMLKGAMKKSRAPNT